MKDVKIIHFPILLISVVLIFDKFGVYALWFSIRMHAIFYLPQFSTFNNNCFIVVDLFT